MSRMQVIETELKVHNMGALRRRASALVHIGNAVRAMPELRYPFTKPYQDNEHAVDTQASLLIPTNRDPKASWQKRSVGAIGLMGAFDDGRMVGTVFVHDGPSMGTGIERLLPDQTYTDYAGSEAYPLLMKPVGEKGALVEATIVVPTFPDETAAPTAEREFIPDDLRDMYCQLDKLPYFTDPGNLFEAIASHPAARRGAAL